MAAPPDPTRPLALSPQPADSDPEAIHAASRAGSLSTIATLLEAHPKLANRADSDQRLPLHWAVSYNHLPVIEHLLPLATDLDASDSLGWTPLHIAANIPNGIEAAKLLLARGADAGAKNDRGQTPLFYAVSRGNLELVRLLLGPPHEASSRVRDKAGQMPIHRAAAVGHRVVVEVLLENNSPVDPKDTEGWTPLHHAIAEGHGDVAVLLLKKGADSGVRDGEGRVAMLDAPDRKVVEFIKKGAEAEGLELVMQ